MSERTVQQAASVTAPAVAARTGVPAGQATAGQAITGQDGYPQRWLMLPVILIAMFMAGFEVTFSS